ncbi:hypothetical protein NP233_g2612 [Leucocoprinus birnbaumii]|uniref:Ribonuclease H1 N-terminal domain-containing protein n=1 Tax=Leucocoprinus birnbaumii TaxID=56174 RepID=A0AAD5W131_9AGAR|nr:hypothetical protein NP233_g2612 [Leucocoprinus birnbaumii]
MKIKEATRKGTRGKGSSSVTANDIPQDVQEAIAVYERIIQDAETLRDESRLAGITANTMSNGNNRNITFGMTAEEANEKYQGIQDQRRALRYRAREAQEKVIQMKKKLGLKFSVKPYVFLFQGIGAKRVLKHAQAAGTQMANDVSANKDTASGKNTNDDTQIDVVKVNAPVNADVDATKVNAAKVDTPVKATKIDTTKGDAAKVTTPKADVLNLVDAPEIGTLKVNAPGLDASKVDTPGFNASKVDAPKVNAPKVDAPKVDAPKVDAPKVEVPKADDLDGNTTGGGSEDTRNKEVKETIVNVCNDNHTQAQDLDVNMSPENPPKLTEELPSKAQHQHAASSETSTENHEGRNTEQQSSKRQRESGSNSEGTAPPVKKARSKMPRAGADAESAKGKLTGIKSMVLALAQGRSPAMQGKAHTRTFPLVIPFNNLEPAHGCLGPDPLAAIHAVDRLTVDKLVEGALTVDQFLHCSNADKDACAHKLADQLDDHLIKGYAIHANGHKLIRWEASLLGRAMLESHETALHILTTDDGNILCAYHAHIMKTKGVHDASPAMSRIAHFFTGRPFLRTATKGKAPAPREPGHLHCGCREDKVLIEAILQKLTILKSSATGKKETMQHEHLQPLQRSFYAQSFMAWTGLKLKHFFKRDSNGKKQTYGDLLRAQIAILEERLEEWLELGVRTLRSDFEEWHWASGLRMSMEQISRWMVDITTKKPQLSCLSNSLTLPTGAGLSGVWAPRLSPNRHGNQQPMGIGNMPPLPQPRRLVGYIVVGDVHEYMRKYELPERVCPEARDIIINDPDEYHRETRKARYAAYAVYCGIKPSVYTSWLDVEHQVGNLPGARFEGFDSIVDACAEFCRLSLLRKCRPLRRLPVPYHLGVSPECDSRSSTSSVEDVKFEDEESDAVGVEQSDPTNMANHQDLRWYVIVGGMKPGVYQGIDAAVEHLGVQGHCEIHSVELESKADKLFRLRFMEGDVVTVRTLARACPDASRDPSLPATVEPSCWCPAPPASHIMLSTRPNTINADINYLPLKTPARGTRNRGENAFQGAMTIQNGKGKSGLMKTPFHPRSAQLQRAMKDAPGSVSFKDPIHLVTRPNRPLADKTPFANRTLNFQHTPAPAHKLLKSDPLPPILKDQNATPDSVSVSARASSTRKHSRVPKASVVFQTPANKGNHWDVSDGDIVIPEMEQVLELEEKFDDSEEVEYLPPNTLDLPYQPPFEFDLPDYKLLGQAVLRNVFSYPAEDLPPPTFDFTLSDQDLMKWDSLSLPSLLSESESFSLAKGVTKQTTTKATTTTAKHSITTRTTSALASHVNSRPTTASSTCRPATSASVQPSAVKPPTTRPSTTTTKLRVTSTTSKPLASSSTRATSSTAHKLSSLSTRVNRSTQSSTRPASVTTSRMPPDRVPTTRTTLKPFAAAAASARASTTRPPSVPRPATATATVRPTTSASIRLASSRARATKPTPASSAPRAASATSIVRRPAISRAGGTSSSLTTRTKSTVPPTTKKSIMTVARQPTKSTKPSGTGIQPKSSSASKNDVAPKASATGDVDRSVPSGENEIIVKVAATLSDVLILNHDGGAEGPKKAENDDSTGSGLHEVVGACGLGEKVSSPASSAMANGVVAGESGGVRRSEDVRMKSGDMQVDDGASPSEPGELKATTEESLRPTSITELI